jgi:hypothetical protein
METNQRRTLAIAGGLALAVCLCLSVIGLAVSGIIVWNVQSPVGQAEETAVQALPETPTEEVDPPATSPVESPEVDPTEDSGPTQEASETEVETPPPSAGLPAEIASQMDEIEAQVIELRGLEPDGEVERDLLTPEQLREHVVNNLLEDYTEEEARNDTRVLAAMGLLDPDFDLYEFYIELYSEQVAGYYDDETQAMYVIQDRGFEGPQRLTYAHEFVHALQDSTYDLDQGLGYNDEDCEGNWDRCAAVQALIEGDASLAELEWFSNFGTPQDAAELQDFYENYESPVYDQAPAFMREDFIFPYLSGQAFVERLHDRRGWGAVDQAYRHLPVSTEQILHPDRYPDDDPTPVELPDLSATLGEGWEEIDRGVRGEWYIRLILAFGRDEAARLEVLEAEAAAEGWDGDTYAVYFNEEAGQTAMVLRTIWESEAEAGQFARAFREYASARFGDPVVEEGERLGWDSAGEHTQLLISGDTTTWILAPDGEIAQAISAEMP